MTVIILLIGIQLIPVDRKNPPVTKEIAANEVARKVLKRACYDCHSNETLWPWYSYVAPVSWLIARHVDHGRDRLNFSEWDKYSLRDKKHILKDIPEEIEEGEMPMDNYLPLHPEAELSEEDIEALEKWVVERKKDLVDQKVKNSNSVE